MPQILVKKKMKTTHLLLAWYRG